MSLVPPNAVIAIIGLRIKRKSYSIYRILYTESQPFIIGILISINIALNPIHYVQLLPSTIYKACKPLLALSFILFNCLRYLDNTSILKYSSSTTKILSHQHLMNVRSYLYIYFYYLSFQTFSWTKFYNFLIHYIFIFRNVCLTYMITLMLLTI